MKDKIYTNIHAGEILLEEFLKPIGITPHKLATETGLDPTRISLIVRGKRSITPEAALKFARFFDQTTPGFWLNLQANFDIREQELKHSKDLKKIKSYKELGKFT